MNIKKINLADFKRDSSFYAPLDFMVTIKSFDLQAIRKRYIASRGNKSGKAGSVERRKPSKGGIAIIRLGSGKVEHKEIVARLFEPRGIHIDNQALAIAAENTIHIYEADGAYFRLTNPWFSYIHTVEFSPYSSDTVLISSSGFDLIQEYNYKTGELLFEWLAWEHGFNSANDPETNREVILTRSEKEAASLAAQQKKFTLISNPLTDHLPTAKRAAFINSVSYHPTNPDLLLTTFFHEGRVYEIDKSDNSASLALENLKNPHGGRKVEAGYMATSTGSGEVVIQKPEEQLRISFVDLPGKPDELEKHEWIQNSTSHNNLIISIDSNRTSFVIIDPAQKYYDLIPYNPDWAVQDLVMGHVTEVQKEKLASL